MPWNGSHSGTSPAHGTAQHGTSPHGTSRAGSAAPGTSRARNQPHPEPAAPGSAAPGSAAPGISPSRGRGISLRAGIGPAANQLARWNQPARRNGPIHHVRFRPVVHHPGRLGLPAGSPRDLKLHQGCVFLDHGGFGRWRPQKSVAVGTALTGGPPRRSQRAGLPHWAPALGVWRQSAPRGMGAGFGSGAASGSRGGPSEPR